MQKITRILILIPTYKEYDNLKTLVSLLYKDIYKDKSLKNIKFLTLIVDDNSPDGTKKLITQYLKKYPNLYVSYDNKNGIGAAMKRGYKYAISKLNVEYVATLEADYVVNPANLKYMIKKISHFDVVLASRKNESEFYKGSLIRRINHVIVNTLVSKYLAGMGEVHEHTAACRIIKVKGVLDSINLDNLPDGYAFFPAILFKLSKVTNKFYEYKVNFNDRTKGESKMKLKFTPLMKEGVDYIRFAILNRRS